MKTISNIGFVIAFLLFCTSIYLQMMMVPHVDHLRDVDMEGFNSATASLFNDANDMMMNVAYTCLLGGGIAFIMCLIGFIKTKHKLALLGVLLALVATFIGIINGTHMFS